MNYLSDRKDETMDVKFHPDGIQYKDPTRIVNILMASGWFFGMFLIFYIFPFTEISFLKIFILFAFFALTATLIPYKYVQKVLPVDYWHVIAVNVAGIGPLCTGLFLLVNMQFAVNPITYRYEIKGFSHNRESFKVNSVTMKLSGDNLESHPDFKIVDYPTYKTNLLEKDSVKITLSDGLLGYTVFEGIEFY